MLKPPQLLAKSGKQYALYLTGATKGECNILVPDGECRIDVQDPKTGKLISSSGMKPIEGKLMVSFETGEDLAVKIMKE